jgi:hypothetical protein
MPSIRLQASAGALTGTLAILTANAGTVIITHVVPEGHTVAGVGDISSGFGASENLGVNNSGGWIVESDTNNADTEADGVVLKGTGHATGTLFLREGQALDLPVGAAIDSFDAITINNSGNGGFNFFLSGTAGTSDDSGVFFNDDLLIQEGTLSTSTEFSPNTPYIGWFETRINNVNQVLMVASIDDPAIATTVDRALVLLDGIGGTLEEIVLSKEGDELITGRFVSDFGTGPHNIALNDSGVVLAIADLDGDTLTDGAVFTALDSALAGSSINILAQEGSPSAVKGRNWGTLIGVPIDLNNDGGWVMRGDLDGGTTDDSLIVRNGTEVIAREGSSLAAIGAFTLTGFGTGAVQIADNGDVLWYGDWNDPDTTKDTGLFINDQLIVQKGITTVGGQAVTAISAVQDNFAMSDNGQWFIFEGTLANGLDGAFLVEIPPACATDITGDSQTNVDDLLAVINGWGQPGPTDIDGNGTTDVDDLLLVINGWGPC